MRQVHRAGETLEVDYAGMTLTVIDMGAPREAQIFVACLPCSQLIYAEASWTQGHEDWLSAHVRALAYIGGCPEKLVPDNRCRPGCTPSLADRWLLLAHCP
jgi:transposase